jgi:hypothetical protein
VFKHLTIKEQLQRVQRENQALKSYTKDLEDAIVELAEVITEEDKDG